MGDLSAHFSLAEFDVGVAGECRGTLVDPVLVCCLERLRHICDDRPLHIVSGYRCPRRNRRVGGALNSQHLYGKAADIPFGYATIAQAREAGFLGVGTRAGFAVHVDVRAVKAEWKYD